MDKYKRIAGLYTVGATLGVNNMPSHHGVILLPSTATIEVTCKLKGATGLESENLSLRATVAHSRIYPLELSSISNITGSGGYIGLLY